MPPHFDDFVDVGILDQDGKTTFGWLPAVVYDLIYDTKKQHRQNLVWKRTVSGFETLYEAIFFCVVDYPIDNRYERKDVAGFEPTPRPARDIQNGKAIEPLKLLVYEAFSY